MQFAAIFFAALCAASVNAAALPGYDQNQGVYVPPVFSYNPAPVCYADKPQSVEQCNQHYYKHTTTQVQQVFTYVTDTYERCDQISVDDKCFKHGHDSHHIRLRLSAWFHAHSLKPWFHHIGHKLHHIGHKIKGKIHHIKHDIHDLILDLKAEFCEDIHELIEIFIELKAIIRVEFHHLHLEIDGHIKDLECAKQVIIDAIRIRAAIKLEHAAEHIHHVGHKVEHVAFHVGDLHRSDSSSDSEEDCHPSNPNCNRSVSSDSSSSSSSSDSESEENCHPGNPHC